MSGGRRRDVLAALRQSAEPMTVAAIADQLDVHVNTVRFHLDGLLESGQVERVPTPPGRPGRPPQLFAPTRGMNAAGPRHFLMLAEALAESVAQGPDPAGQAETAGRLMGKQLAKSRSGDEALSSLVELLDEMGFDPEVDGDSIGLRHCPFLEVAKGRPEVVCPVHLGMMQAATEAWDSPLSVTSLQPFVEPDLCVAHLTGASS